MVERDVREVANLFVYMTDRNRRDRDYVRIHKAGVEVPAPEFDSVDACWRYIRAFEKLPKLIGGRTLHGHDDIETLERYLVCSELTDQGIREAWALASAWHVIHD